MYCEDHDRLCYMMINGDCGVYTCDNIREHATKLVSVIFIFLKKICAERFLRQMENRALYPTRFRSPWRLSCLTSSGGVGLAGFVLNCASSPLLLLRPRKLKSLQRPCPSRPLDYPTIANWLQICEEDFERGRDKHEYTKLAPMFAANGCTRIDDIPRMSTDSIKSLTVEAGLDVTIGLVNRVHDYAVEDVARVKHDGKLVL